jgi:cytochrome c oxidase cbb3-type subunit 3
MNTLRLPVVVLIACTCLPRVVVAESPDGAELYQQNCSVCHGADGAGGVGIPLNLPDFLAVASDDYLRRTLRLGRPGRVMPAFPELDDAQINAIVAYIRSWSDQPGPRYGTDALQGDPQRGEELYTKHCVGCHGEDGQGGTGTGVTFSRPREAPLMAPALGNPGFQRSVSDAMLKASLLRGREGTPMPSLKAFGLQDKDADDLVAYLRRLAREAPQEDEAGLEPIIGFESPYTLEQTLENLKQAVLGRNFRIIREQYLEQGLVPEGQENRRQVILYFCNFAFLNEALAIDPRVGLFLPCRITLLETEQGVQVMSINPKNLSRLFNNEELDKACEEMHDLYAGIIEEVTL